MGYGLKIKNPSGGLVIDSEGFGMNYIGTATYYGTVVHPRTGTSLGFDAAYDTGTAVNISEYRITSTATTLIPFVKITSTYNCALISVSKINSNTWSIKIYCSGSGLEIFCFAKTTTVPTGYGMALYDSSGNVSYNLCNAGSPLFFQSIADFPDDTSNGSPTHSATITGAALSSYTKPAVFGWNLGYNFYCGPGSPPHPLEINTWQAIGIQGFGLQISSNVLYRTAYNLVPLYNFDAGSDLPVANNDLNLPATSVVIIEANGLVTS